MTDERLALQRRRPHSAGAALLRLDPWRLHVADAPTVASPQVWRPATAYR